MDTERAGFDLSSVFYSSASLFIPGFTNFYHFDSTVLVSGESRTLPTSSEFLAILGLLLFQTNFTIILSYPHQVHKRLWRTIWNWIEYMNKLRIYIIAIFSSMKIICISLYVYPFEYPLVQLHNSLFSILSPMILFSSVLFRVLKVTSRHQRFCNHIYTLDPRGGLSVNASVQLKCNTLLFSSAASRDTSHTTMITFLCFFPFQAYCYLTSGCNCYEASSLIFSCFLQLVSVSPSEPMTTPCFCNPSIGLSEGLGTS